MNQTMRKPPSLQDTKFHQGKQGKFEPISLEQDQIGSSTVHAAYKIHKAIGPGLLEKVYVVSLTNTLSKHGFRSNVRFKSLWSMRTLLLMRAWWFKNTP